MSEPKQRKCSGSCGSWFSEAAMIRKKGCGTTTFRCQACSAKANASQAERDAFGERKRETNRNEQRERMLGGVRSVRGFELGS